MQIQQVLKRKKVLFGLAGSLSTLFAAYLIYKLKSKWHFSKKELKLIIDKLF